MPSGARLFAEALASLNPCPVFTLVGDHLNGVLAELARLGVPIIDMRHESAVAHAADAYARLSRRPALALVTGGPGHTNALTGLATAHLACSPLVLVSGSRSRAVADRGGFQDLDQTAMARPACKWAAEVAAPAQIPFYLRRAFEVAQAGRPGPVHLTVPVDVFETAADGPPAISQTQVSPVTPSGPELERAIELLRSSRRPVAIAGSGVWWSDAGQHLGAFIEKTGIALYTMNMARGVIPDNHPQCFGFADPALNRAAHSAYQEADLFLILGKRLDYRLALGSTRVIPAGAKCIQVDIDAGEFGINRRIDVALHADVKQTLATLTASLASSARPEWTARQNELRDQWRARLSAAQQDRSSPIHPSVVFGEMAKALPMGALISWDGGDFTHWGRAIVPALQPGGWLRLGPLGTIGSALPNGIAQQIANPGKPVLVITGDGALGFYIAEMETAVRYKLPIVIVVGNDGGWGLERELQTAQGTLGPRGETIACELQRSRYDLIMQAFGGAGELVEGPDEVAPAIGRAFESGRPYCINVNVRGARSPFTDWQIEGKRQSGR